MLKNIKLFFYLNLILDLNYLFSMQNEIENKITNQEELLEKKQLLIETNLVEQDFLKYDRNYFFTTKTHSAVKLNCLIWLKHNIQNFILHINLKEHAFIKSHQMVHIFGENQENLKFFFRVYQEYTPLFFAVINDNVKIAELLLQAGAKVSMHSKYISKPIHYVRSIKMTELLLEKGADLNAIDIEGKTVLHYVSSNLNSQERINLIKFFLNKNAKLEILDVNHKKPQDYITQEEYEEIISKITND